MDKHELTDEDSKQNLDQQIKDLLKKLEILNEERIILKDATGLEEMERKIIATTDKLAGLMTARKIQQTIDSDESKTEAKELIDSHPKKFKNQGVRRVNIKVARGESVEIEVPYFSRKGKKKNEKGRHLSVANASGDLRPMQSLPGIGSVHNGGRIEFFPGGLRHNEGKRSGNRR